MRGGNRKVKNNRQKQAWIQKKYGIRLKEIVENKEKLRGRRKGSKDTQKWWENTGIREKRKWERKNNDIRVVLKGSFVEKTKNSPFISILKKKKKILYLFQMSKIQ